MSFQLAVLQGFDQGFHRLPERKSTGSAYSSLPAGMCSVNSTCNVFELAVLCGYDFSQDTLCPGLQRPVSLHPA